MKAKKADISMNMIVYIAIALLILVLVVAFVTGGFGKMFTGLAKTAPQELETIKADCQGDCNKAKGYVETSGIEAWASSDYAKTKHAYDKNNDGQIAADGSEHLFCWDSPISVTCTKNILNDDGVLTYECGKKDNEAKCVAPGP